MTKSFYALHSDWLTKEQNTVVVQMQALLAHNVPRFINHIKNRNGPSDDELRWLRCEEERSQASSDVPSEEQLLRALNYPLEVLMRADEYLLYPKNHETFMHGVFILVKVLAIMSFFPSGVRFFNLHFCSEIENFYTNEDGCRET